MKKVKLPTIDKKNFPYDLVQVIWEDIVGDAGWAAIPEIKNASTAICCSLGYLVFQDDKKTIIMSDFIFEDNGKVKTGGGYTTLPTTNVLQIKKIKT